MARLSQVPREGTQGLLRDTQGSVREGTQCPWGGIRESVREGTQCLWRGTRGSVTEYTQGLWRGTRGSVGNGGRRLPGCERERIQHGEGIPGIRQEGRVTTSKYPHSRRVGRHTRTFLWMISRIEPFIPP